MARGIQMILFICLFSSLMISPPVTAFIPDDPGFENQWIFDKHNFTSVWENGYDYRTVENAVGLCFLGSFVGDQQGDLNVTERKSFIQYNNGTEVPYPTSDTSILNTNSIMASLAASTINNNLGIAGVVNAPVYSAWWGGNNLTRAMQSYTDAISWCTSKGKVVIPMAFFWELGVNYTTPVVEAVKTTMNSLYTTGNVLYFSMSGNVVEDLNETLFPHTFDNVRTIGKSRFDGSHDTGSRGKNLFLAAPGQSLIAYNHLTDKFDFAWGGSSGAVAIAAAAATLLWNQFPNLTNEQIADSLRLSATDLGTEGWDDKTGWGLLNIAGAREYLVNLPTSSSTTSSSSSTNTSSEEADDDDSPIFFEIFMVSFIIVIQIKKRIKL